MKHFHRLIKISVTGTLVLLLSACGNESNTDPDPDPDSNSEAQASAAQPESVSTQSPNLNGIWQVLGSAAWNLEGHVASKGPVTGVLGALGGIPAGMSVVEGGTIPYKPEALAQRNLNRASWSELDPVVKCYIPGIPRATYMPFPLQILQSESKVFIAYEFGSNSRIIHMDRPGTEAALPSWMGYSLGHWEGDTLVVEVSEQMADTWFDSSGNYHSGALKVTERYTPMGPNHLRYEATIEDPEVFTQPWKISIPLYRRMESGSRLLEFKCVEFAEDVMYNHLRKGFEGSEITDQ